MHPDEHSESNGSTGPRTPAGKAVSSMNRLTHGCRSEKTILRQEDHADYTALMEGWLHQYNPQNPAERVLVDQTAHAQWILMRNQRRFAEVDYEKNLNFRNWTENQIHEYELALRYKTAAERSFLRWFKELESYYARAQRKQRPEPEKLPSLETLPPALRRVDPALVIYPVFKPASHNLESIVPVESLSTEMTEQTSLLSREPPEANDNFTNKGQHNTCPKHAQNPPCDVA